MHFLSPGIIKQSNLTSTLSVTKRSPFHQATSFLVASFWLTIAKSCSRMYGLKMISADQHTRSRVSGRQLMNESDIPTTKMFLEMEGGNSRQAEPN